MKLEQLTDLTHLHPDPGANTHMRAEKREMMGEKQQVEEYREFQTKGRKNLGLQQRLIHIAHNTGKHFRNQTTSNLGCVFHTLM